MGKQRQKKQADAPKRTAAETGDAGRAGRPPGAGNHDYSKIVTIRGVTCPHCGSEDVVVVTDLAPFEPTEYDGVRTDRHRMRCRACPGRFMRLTQTPIT
jgi:hypothetical protein